MLCPDELIGLETMLRLYHNTRIKAPILFSKRKFPFQGALPQHLTGSRTASWADNPPFLQQVNYARRMVVSYAHALLQQ